jgi:cell shape-determining protein MreC
MAIYSVGRRRVIIALLLTSALLLTLDLRGSQVIDRVRDGASTAMQPFDAAAEAITTPVSRAWRGIVEYDDLERRNQELQDQVDRLIGTQASAEASVIEYQELLALNNLPALAGIDTEVAQVIGTSSNNLDQVVEINKGRSSGIQIGMPVVNQAGLIGKITAPVTLSSARVMLLADKRYSVAVRISSGTPCVDETTVDTSPSGLTDAEIRDQATTSTTTAPTDEDPFERDPSAVVPDSTLPGGGTTTLPDLSGLVPTTDPLVPTTEEGTESIDPASTSTTTTTIPEPVEKEFGALEGRGGDRLPQIRFLQNNPSLAELEECDLVETAGGSESLAPPGIPVGEVANRADRSGSGGPLLDVDPYADLDALNFVRVALYKPLSEVEE